MCYNMLARKAGYTHYEGLQEHGQSGTTSYAGMEERRFGRLLRQTIVIVGIIGVFMLACVALSAIKANNSYVLMRTSCMRASCSMKTKCSAWILPN